MAGVAAGCFLETMSRTVEAIEEPPSGFRRDPLEAALDPPVKNGFSALASTAAAAVTAAGPVSAVGASACGGLSFSCTESLKSHE